MCLRDNRLWDTVRSYNEFVDKITKCGLPVFISFDHDLADQQYPQGDEQIFEIDYTKGRYGSNTGYHCAQWLINYCRENKLPLPSYQCHSMNPVGKANIIQLLNKYKETQNYDRQSDTGQ